MGHFRACGGPFSEGHQEEKNILSWMNSSLKGRVCPRAGGRKWAAGKEGSWRADVRVCPNLPLLRWGRALPSSQ